MYNLWEIRKRKGLSMKELAARSGIAARVLVQYENGEKVIPYADLSRLAKALYVEEWEIKTQSDPPPDRRRRPAHARPRPSGRPHRTSTAPAPKRPAQAAPPKPKRKAPPPPSPARETQLAHLRQLLPVVGKTVEDVERMVGKPLEEFTRREASQLLFELQEILRERKQATGDEGSHNRHRAYLPEGVDRFELEYLTRVQDEAQRVRFHLFDGSEVVGRIVGFGPYSITVTVNGEETTLNKLAIAWYTVEGDKGGQDT